MGFLAGNPGKGLLNQFARGSMIKEDDVELIPTENSNLKCWLPDVEIYSYDRPD